MTGWLAGFLFPLLAPSRARIDEIPGIEPKQEAASQLVALRHAARLAALEFR